VGNAQGAGPARTRRGRDPGRHRAKIIGETVTVLGRRLAVVGISAGTYSMANSVTFVSHGDLAELLSAPAAASYFLVEATADESAVELAARIRRAVPDVNAMSRDAFVASDWRMAMQMGVEIIRLMTWVGSLVAALIVAFTAYASTVRRSHELGVAKALGLRNRGLYATLFVHTLVVSSLGCLIGIAVARGARPLIEGFVPEVVFRLQRPRRAPGGRAYGRRIVQQLHGHDPHSSSTGRTPPGPPGSGVRSRARAA
jgi:putative ABC transport system permease protein